MAKDMEKARRVYDLVCAMFDARKLVYEKREEDLVIHCEARGDDLPMDFLIRVNPELSIVSFYSDLPFRVPEEKRLDVAVAVTAINYMIVDGNFDLDFSDGQVLFRVNNSYLDSEPDMEVFNYMLSITAGAVDEYNDKLLMLAKGYIDLEQFLANLSE